MIIDKLFERVRDRSFVCCGLDSSLDYIPSGFKEKYQDIDEIIFQYNKAIIDSTEDLVAIYKLQIAYYEAEGLKGMEAYKRTLKYLRSKDLLSIGDVKRGDISSTAKAYAKAHFEGDFESDFITVNPYMGYDSISPYLPYLEGGDKGIFVLLRTSNEGAKDIEYLKLQSGERLYYQVGDHIYDMAEKYVGSCGYSSLSFVVGGTSSLEAREIRERYGKSFFLIPGYGAQGGKAEDIRLYLKDFNGGIVNSSRGIINAWSKKPDGEDNFESITRQAVVDMIGEIHG